MGIESINKRIRELNAAIDKLSDERSALRQQLAEMQTTFKVGDLVTAEGANCVWKLTAIRPGYGNTPKYYGAKIKKDGTTSVVVNEIWRANYGKGLVKPNTRIERLDGRAEK